MQDPNSPPHDSSSGGSSPNAMQENGGFEEPISDNNVTTTNELSDAYEVPTFGDVAAWEEEELEFVPSSPERVPVGIPVGGGMGEDSAYFPHPHQPPLRNRMRSRIDPKGVTPTISPLSNGNARELLP